MLTQSRIPHPALELCREPAFRGKPIDDVTRFSFVAWMDCNGDPEWTDQCFPDDVCNLLLLLCLDDEVDFDKYSEEDISDDDDDGEEEELWWRIET